ncbi:MAG TPA: DUF4012 domain-containing protein [Candidatus Moranbacteria bacterium]|nr:DUF4012 domain-containing protein [Candidatus Moranbacteria bacterium]
MNNDKLNLKVFITRKKIITLSIIVALVIGGFFAFLYAKNNKKSVALVSLNAISKVSKFLPISQDSKKELEVLNSVVSELTKKDDIEKSFLILLQNADELRPGGGFLGQYAIIKIKNGNIVSTYVEDANLLDQRIQAKVAPPFPFYRLMQLRKWKFRDSNFSPDFPTNVEKAKYFFRLAGRDSKQFDGVIAVNSLVFNNIFNLTGPIAVPGYGGEFNSENASRKLEEIVEKNYLLNPDLDTQNRKAIIKKLAPIMMDKLATVGNVTKIAEFFHNELKNRNVMINLTDTNLQQKVASVFWDGSVPQSWGGDYLMAVDANMGALKTDHYIKREMKYDLDFTQPKPIATLNIKYKNTAPYGDWRTSDYHSYLRVYVPKGSEFVSSHMVSRLATSEELNKTYFGFKADVIMGQELDSKVIYTLPDHIKAENYKLLIQKQSGVGNIPITVHIKTHDNEFTQQHTLQSDLKFEFSKQ